MQHHLVMRCRKTLLPLTNAMFSPRPTLFFTLLSNLRQRHGTLKHEQKHFRRTSLCFPHKNVSTHAYRLACYLRIIIHTTDQSKRLGDRLTERILAFRIPDRLEGLFMTAMRKKRTEHQPRKGRKERKKWDDKGGGREKELVSTESHILSSRQILGPMTLAAPDTRRKAKCFGGQGAESPHLYFRGRISARMYDILVSGWWYGCNIIMETFNRTRSHKMVTI